MTPQIGLSLLLHLAVVALAIFKIFLFPSQPIIYSQAIRVDIVGLPEKRTTPRAEAKPVTKQMPAPQLEKAAPKLVEKSKVNFSKKAEHDALERIRALEDIENQVRADAQKKVEQVQKFKGNVLSPGSELNGVDQLQHDQYVALLDQQVKKNWELPQWLANANLHARVLVQIDQNGLVLSRKIIESSQNAVFDAKALAAIDHAAPFPKPPDKFVKILEVNGVEFGFPE